MIRNVELHRSVRFKRTNPFFSYFLRGFKVNLKVTQVCSTPHNNQGLLFFLSPVGGKCLPDSFVLRNSTPNYNGAVDGSG